MRKPIAAFLDRDGVINKDVGYLSRAEEIYILPNVISALSELKRQGFLNIIITNQSGIARGYFSEETFISVNKAIVRKLNRNNTLIDTYYYCPHHPQAVLPEYREQCECRKPAPGMILNAAAQFDLDLSGSILVGDKETDIEAGIAAGIGKTFLLRPSNVSEIPTNASYICKDLLEVASHITGTS